MTPQQLASFRTLIETRLAETETAIAGATANAGTVVLARIAKDNFGTCCECGEEISGPRLQSDPGTPFCTVCQENREH